MKVLLLAENLAFGGINRYCLDLAQGLRAYGDVHCNLLALSSAGDDWLLSEAKHMGLDVEVLPVSSLGILRRILVERRVDIVHSQGYRSNILARLAIHLHRLHTRSVNTVHGAYYFPTAAWQSKVYYLADYLTMRLSRRVIAVSAATQRQVSRWAGNGRLAMIHNGTVLPPLPDVLERMTRREALGLAEGAKVVCFVGRLSPQKGIPTLLDTVRTTAKSAPDVIFVVVGDGELRPEVESCAREIGPQMRFVGAQRVVHSYYTSADALLLPSRTEGLPMTLIEAFAHGVPAVASNVGGIPEVLTDGYNGFLCPNDDTAQMSQRLLQLLHDDDLRLRLGANARKTAETAYSLPSMVEATYQVYRSLVGQG